MACGPDRGDGLGDVSPRDALGGGWQWWQRFAEEEFGSWAVKINAGITFIEYTLTFLVSMAALVTFIADRLPILNQSVLAFNFAPLSPSFLAS